MSKSFLDMVLFLTKNDTHIVYTYVYYYVRTKTHWSKEIG